MPWNQSYRMDEVKFCFTTLLGPPGILFEIEQLLELTSEDLQKIQEWASENAEELYAIGFAGEYGWDTQYVDAEKLRVILNSKTATDFERQKAGEALEFVLRGEEYPPRIEEKPIKRKQLGYVYLLVAENGLHKIGRAKRLNDRVTQLAVKFPMKIKLVHSIMSDDYIQAEIYLHERFASRRVHGEWFDLSAADIAYICGIEKIDSERLPLV